MGQNLDHAPLGKSSDYPSQYDAGLLFPVPRTGKREELGIESDQALPFHGVDIWNAWEVSWLNQKGKPIVAIAEFRIPADSPNIIESKSFKLYLNSLNQTKFDTEEDVIKLVEADLSACADAPVTARLIGPDEEDEAIDVAHVPASQEVSCIDDLDVEIDCYETNADLLALDNISSAEVVQETVISHLLKSNCPVTSQPDWGTVVIQYHGKKISHEALLRYIVSFRQHTEFHEQCVERIFMDISKLVEPESLLVYARYVRRGGLDINPYRASMSTPVQRFSNKRLARQ